LVPIGDDKIAFITDEVRHYILKTKIEQQHQIEIKSNLAKSEGGWGAGYMAKDGKSVVGAAHGIEEMIKMAQREKSKFTDGAIPFPSSEEKILQELAEEARRQQGAETKVSGAPTGDLLGFSEPSAGVDLLDFGDTSNATTAASTGDLLGDFGAAANPTNIFSSSGASDDLLGLAPSMARPPCPQQSLLDLANEYQPVDDGLLSLAVPDFGGLDPYGSVGAFQPSVNGLLGGVEMNGLSGRMSTLSIGTLSAPAMVPVQENRFAALDALASTAFTPNPTTSLDSQMVDYQQISAGARTSGFNVGTGQSWSLSSSGYASSTSVPHPMVAPGSGHIAAAYGDEGDIGNPWVMGGSTGTGLQPLGEAPAAAPPPPPPQ
jgi:hypothetical protein